MTTRNSTIDMSAGIDEGLDLYDKAEERALVRIERSGLALRQSPPRTSAGKFFDGRVPINLGTRTPAEIGEYYGLMVEYTDYVEGQLVLARTEMLTAEAKLSHVHANVRKSKTGTVQDKGDLSTIDIRFVEANANYIEAKTYYELISAIGEAARRDVKFVSRIIETKKMELDMGGRGGAINRPYGGGSDRFRHKN